MLIIYVHNHINVHIYMLYMCAFLFSSLSSFMLPYYAIMATWIFTKGVGSICLLWIKQLLSFQHLHLASVPCCCSSLPWVLLCRSQTLYWSPLRKPHPDLRQRKLCCSPNDWEFCFVVEEGRVVLCVLSSVFAMHLLATTHSGVSFLTREDFTTTVMDIGGPWK